MTELLDAPPRSSPTKKVTPLGAQPVAHPLATAMAVGAAVATVAEVGHALEARRAMEQPSDPRNIFEVGRHFVDKKDLQHVSDAFDQDDPYANNWSGNTELKNRLISYKPGVLTIDGLPVPIHYGKYDNEVMPTPKKHRLRDLVIGAMTVFLATTLAASADSKNASLPAQRSDKGTGAQHDGSTGDPQVDKVVNDLRARPKLIVRR